MTNINQPWTSKNSSAKRSFIKDSIEPKNLFQRARVSNQSSGNNSSFNIKSSNSAVRKAQFSLERKNTSQLNQQSNRLSTITHIEQGRQTFSNNRKSESKKITSIAGQNKMEEFSQSISHPNIKQASYVIPDSGTFLIS